GSLWLRSLYLVFFFQAEDGIRDFHVTGVQTCALPIFRFAPFLDEREVSQVLIFLDGGDPAYSLLLAYWGEEELVGVPFAPQGLEYFVHPDAELGGYFRLTEDPIVGLLGTYGFGAPLSIGELEGGLEIADAALFVSGRLSVGDRV